MGGTFKAPKVNETAPGPLAYSDAATRKSVPAASMTFRKPDRDDAAIIAAKRGGADLIGITHEQHIRREAPSITMSARHDYATKKWEQQASLAPGPNAYLHSDPSAKRVSAARIVGRPKSPRTRQDHPGPADVTIAVPKSTKSALILGPHKAMPSWQDIGPGPGAYRVSMTSSGVNMRSTKGGTMSFKPRVTPHLRADPGPGDYAPAVPRSATRTLVMKKPADPAHTQLRRTQGADNLRRLTALQEQKQRRQAAAREVLR